MSVKMLNLYVTKGTNKSRLWYFLQDNCLGIFQDISAGNDNNKTKQKQGDYFRWKETKKRKCYE